MLNSQILALAQRDNCVDADALTTRYYYERALLAERLPDWTNPYQSVCQAMHVPLLWVLVVLWWGTALVCLGPGFDWGFPRPAGKRAGHCLRVYVALVYIGLAGVCGIYRHFYLIVNKPSWPVPF